MKVQRTIKVLAIVLGFIGLLVTVALTQRYDNKEAVKSFRVKINELEGDAFLEEDEIEEIIIAKVDSLVGKQKQQVNLSEIEQLILTQPAVKTAEVYMDVPGNVVAEVKLRKVLIRVKPDSTKGYYIDEAGEKMMWVSSYTPRVLVLSGHLHKYDSLLQPSLSKADRQKMLFEHAYEFAKTVAEDSLWSKQLTQVFINEEGDAELKTLIGNQKIILGRLSDPKKNLQKLKLFYEEVVKKVGWLKYREVNLKFEDQIVCK